MGVRISLSLTWVQMQTHTWAQLQALAQTRALTLTFALTAALMLMQIFMLVLEHRSIEVYSAANTHLHKIASYILLQPPQLHTETHAQNGTQSRR